MNLRKKHPIKEMHPNPMPINLFLDKRIPLFYSETKIAIKTNCSGTKCDNQDLDTENTGNNDCKFFVSSDAFKNIDFISKSSTIDEIKQLQTNEYIENIGELINNNNKYMS